MAAGAALGLAGALLQLLLRNPIADPSTLGISAGAQLAIVSATLYFPAIVDEHRTAVALSGAVIAASLVFALGWRRSFEPVVMVISGLLVGVTAASISAAITLSRGEYLMSLITWNGGALSQQDWSVATMLSLQFVAASLLAVVLVRPLAVLGLGDVNARNLGVNLGLFRFSVAAVGLVSFVGLAAPAFVRACGARRPAVIVASSPLAGALFLWICDGIVQALARSSSEVFPTGAVTALFGGPLLLWLLPKVRSMEVSDGRQGDFARTRLTRAIAIFFVLVPVVTACAFFFGPTNGWWRLLTMEEVSSLLPMRWPRLVSAAAAGSLLALTGALLQRMTSNPMASPEVIGVSGGAGLGFAAAVTLLPNGGQIALFGGAAVGALVTVVAVLAFASQKNLPPGKVLLAGIAVGSFSSSVLAALMAVGDQRSWQILTWLGGTAATATPMTTVILVTCAFAMLIASLCFSRWLSILPFGVPVALSLGVPVMNGRIVMLSACGLATGAASLLVGPLSFVGLIAPHIALRAGLVTASRHIAGSFMLGAILMALADIGARSVTFPYELPLGLFAALIGAPYLIWLLGRKQ